MRRTHPARQKMALPTLAAAGWVALLIAPTGPAPGQPVSLQPLVRQEQRESVYAPPAPAREDEGLNQGAVHVALGVSYLTDYVWRGIERFEFDPRFATIPNGNSTSKEDFANIQFEGRLSFDLGKFPSPFVELFVNAAEDQQGEDQSFQEIRPTVGFDWNLRPLKFSGGHTSYIFPEDETDANGVPESSEIFGRLEIDDSYFFRTERPVFSPYVFAAYDYDEFEGSYIEAGGKHVFQFEDTGLTLTLNAHVAYVSGLTEVYGDSSGFQHYQVGLTGEYSLNQLLNFSTRYGEWSIRGYLNFTGEIDKDLHADDQLWGGAGIGFKY